MKNTENSRVIVITGASAGVGRATAKAFASKKAQPVPPIYQPEVAARAILYASRHDRREIYVGLPTVKAIIGNKLFADLLDHYLAHTGYESQETDEPEDPNRRNNLYEPVAGDHGAHGRFDSRSRDFSPQLWTDLHRDGLAAFIMAASLTLGMVLLARKNAPSKRPL